MADHACTVPAFLALAIVSRERDDPGRANDLLDAARRRSDGSPFAESLLTVEQAQIEFAFGALDEGLAFLAAHRPHETPSETGLIGRRRAIEARLLSSQGLAERADAVLESTTHGTTLDVAVERARLALTNFDLATAERLLEQWPADPQPRASWSRLLWAAAVADRTGDGKRATQLVSSVVRDVEPEDHIGLFLEVGRPILGPVRALYDLAPGPFLRRIVEHPVLTAVSSSGGGRGVIERLTEQEMIVLSYLPTRLSNAAIAQRLDVSLNTIKTHLKHIYQKLNVTSRSEAIAAGERLRLL